MHELLNELVQYHHIKAAVLTDIQQLYAAVKSDNADARDRLGVLFASFRNDNERAHHHNEELILHELIQTNNPVHARIERTAEEHVVFGQLVQRICEEISGSIEEPAIVVANVEWFLNQYDDHASNEEAILFPAADRQLSAGAWNRVQSNWIDVSEPLVATR